MSDYSLQGGVIHFKGKIWLTGNTTVQRKVMAALRNSASGGHSGFPVTFQRIQQLFFWRSMKQDIKHFVQECATCQQAKPERVRYPGLLQLLPIPDQAWQMVS